MIDPFLNRRLILAALPSFLTGCAMPLRSAGAVSNLEKLEREAGGRLGVYVHNTANGQGWGYRSDERFGMCSTFKLPLAGLVLQEADAGRLSLDQKMTFGEADRVNYMPYAQQWVARGWMTIGEMARATQITSDNLAANLLIRHFGGPEAVTRMFRALGDDKTRLDRMEPAMNMVPPGELRDTTTPRAMAALVSRFVTGSLLKPQSRATMIGWMRETETGLKRIRAGLPAGWRAGDKTGTAQADGMPDKINDVAVAWPRGGDPIVIAAYLEAPARGENISDADQAVLAKVGSLVAQASAQ